MEDNQGTSQAATPEVSLDQLIDETFSTPEFNTSEPHKGIDYKKVIDALPDDARKLVANLRNDYRVKTTAISERSKALEAREAHLLSQETTDRLRAAQQLPDDLDVYDPAGLKKYIDAQAAKQLEEMLAPARQELALTTRKQEIETFKATRPDFDSLKDKMAQAIQDNRVNSIEDAYHYVRGLSSQSEIAKRDAELEAHRKLTREAGLKVSTGTTAQSGKPKFKSAWESYEYELARRGR